MFSSTRSRRSGAKQVASAAAAKSHYSTWQPIDIERARKAYIQGAELFSLPGRYHSEGVVYTAGITVPRGGSYLVSESIRHELNAEFAHSPVPDSARPASLTPKRAAARL